jgi:hypothetical protein
MWVIYRKKDHGIVGLSAECEPDLEREQALNSIVNGLVEPEPIGRYDAIQVTDRAKAQAFISAYPESLAIRESSKGKLQLAIEPPRRFRLLLSCDAPDVHPVDGMPEITADGESFTIIKVQKIDEQGEPQQGKNDNDQLYLRANYGTLLTADGSAEIVSFKLKKGEASFRLVSEQNRRVATVQVFSADNYLLDATISVEFI